MTQDATPPERPKGWVVDQREREQFDAQLARLVGTSRNTVVAALSELRDRGVIMTSRRRLMVNDPQLLLELAAGNATVQRPSQAV